MNATSAPAGALPLYLHVLSSGIIQTSSLSPSSPLSPPSFSDLHIIIFDEFDAICKKRGSGATGGTGVGDTIVNQLLTKVRTGTTPDLALLYISLAIW